MILFFLSSGLFLGWSLGANDAANVFGSAVGSRMISFKKAVTILSVFVVLGAVFQGSGASHILSKLGDVDAIAGAFTVALAAALAVFIMTKNRMPVSTSQAIVGAIIGWNIFSGNETDYSSLTKIVSTWIICPILGAVFAILLHLLVKLIINKSKIHLIRLDKYLRNGLMIVGAFGSFSLGANNIANVMGVFITAAAPEKSIDLGLFVLSGTQQLFLIGGIAIAVGAITYSKKIMHTVGSNILALSSESALVVVLAHSLVLFVFSSQSLQSFLISVGLPAIPLVPVSSSQAIVGAILGVGLLKQAREIKFNVIGNIATGWVTTPILAGLISFFSLFIMSNVFNLEVAKSNSAIENSDPVISSIVDNLTDSTTLAKNAYYSDSTKVIVDSRVLLESNGDTLVFKVDPIKEKMVSKGDNSNMMFSKQFLFILGSIIALTIIGLIIYFYKKKLREDRELLEKSNQIDESNNAYMMAELENIKILNEALEAELESQKRELTNLALNLIKKNEFLSDIEGIIKVIKSSNDIQVKEKSIAKLLTKINQSLNIDKERKIFYSYIEEAYNDFFIKLEQAFPDLSQRERQLAALLRLNLSSKDIAQLQNILLKSVEMKRYRLRQKMNVDPGDSLTGFINKI